MTSKPTENESSAKDYEDWHAGRGVNYEAKEIWHRKIIASSDRLDFAGKDVLEIGCGRGGFAIWLASQDYAPSRLTAKDFSAEAVRQAQEAATNREVRSEMVIERGDITAIDRPDASFDTVISCETIEHVLDPQRAVQELSRVLKPGGKFLLTTPNYFNLFGMWRIYRKIVGRPYTEAGQPINQFVMLPQTLHWVKNAGIEVETFGSAEFLIPRWKRPSAHVKPPESMMGVAKWFGLQSWVVGRKSV